MKTIRLTMREATDAKDLRVARAPDVPYYVVEGLPKRERMLIVQWLDGRWRIAVPGEAIDPKSESYSSPHAALAALKPRYGVRRTYPSRKSLWASIRGR